MNWDEGKGTQSKLVKLAAHLRWNARVTASALGSTAVAVLLASLLAGSASAATFSESFCLPGGGEAAGQCQTPTGVAIDQSGGPGGTGGTVYVVDDGTSRVDAFDSAGHFLMAFGLGVATGAAELQTCTVVCGAGVGEDRPETIAVDQTTHDLYASEWRIGVGPAHIQKFAFDPLLQEFKSLLTFGAPGSGPGQLDGELPLAVDSSGNLLVGDLDHIQRFSESGAFISEVKLPSPGVVRSLAVDPSGDFYTVTDLDGVQQITPPTSGTYTLTIGGRFTTSSLVGGAAAKAGEVEAAITAAFEGFHLFDVEGPEGGPFVVEEVREPGTPLGSENVELSSSVASIALLQEGGVATQIDKLGPSGALLEALDVGGHPQAVGLDPGTGELFAGDCVRSSPLTACDSPYTLLTYAPNGEQTGAFGSGEVIGDPKGNVLAFGDAAQRLYTGAGQIFRLPSQGPLVENGSAATSAVRKTTATLNASVNPEGKATTYRFQYIAEQQFSKNEGEGREGFAGAEETGLSASIGENFSTHHVSVPLTGLVPATAYRFRVIAFNASNAKGVDGETAAFETLPPASVDASVTDVTAASVTLTAQINPLGEETSYRFEYLPSEARRRNEEAGLAPFTGASQAPATLLAVGAGEEAVSVFQHVQGLAAHTAYSYRVVVVNASAPTGFASQVLAFTTQSFAVASALPDGRQWELVSAPDKHGALLFAIGREEVIQAAASGEAIAYQGTAPTELELQGFTANVQVLSARGGAGWTSRDLPGSHPKTTGIKVGKGYEYRAFSTDLSLGLLQPIGAFEPGLSAEASEQTLYLRKNFGTEGSSFCEESCYLPLLTTEDVTSGAQFGVCEKADPVDCTAEFVGSSPDLSAVVLSSKVGLTSVPGEKGGLYEYSHGRLALVSLLPGEIPVTDAALGFANQIARGAVSADGSRVFWSPGGTNEGQLYMRDLPKGETIELDLAQGGSGAGVPKARFQFASEDGSRAFFTDNQPLTPNSGASVSAPDLYECQIEEQAGHLHCDLADLTPLAGGESGDVLGTMTGASADGSYAYFIARGDLTGSQANEQGEAAHAGLPNLYLHHEGATVFIATLANEDDAEWARAESDLSDLAARVSPNGLWLAFMSQHALTGYDNRDAVSGRRDEEVFLYHAVGGKLICASCEPTGARPHGVEYGSTFTRHMPLAGGDGVWGEEQWIAANIPGWIAYSGGLARHQPRYLSDSGRLFFNSGDALVPQDSNGTQDVYEYEPPRGESSAPNDGCSESDPGYDPLAAGCVSLISSGTSPEESAFLDASETGNDVFFLTNSRLTTLDVDDARDVYDAHVCTSESPCPPPPPPPPPNCQGDGCQAPAVSPAALTPGSLTFSGPGNAVPATTAATAPKAKPATRAQKLARALRTCRKKKVKRKRTICEKQARRAYGASAKAGKSSKGAGR